MAATVYNNREAAYYIARCYANGNGTNQNLDDAIFFYWQAAKADHPEAWYKLGNYYERGKGVKQDCKKAFFLYKIGATLGSAGALYRLGLCYLHGTGIQKDRDLAISYLQKANNLSCLDAMYTLDHLPDMLIELEQQDESPYIQFLTEATKLGHYPLWKSWGIVISKVLEYLVISRKLSNYTQLARMRGTH